jgi:hypothetical protein
MCVVGTEDAEVKGMGILVLVGLVGFVGLCDSGSGVTRGGAPKLRLLGKSCKTGWADVKKRGH